MGKLAVDLPCEERSVIASWLIQLVAILGEIDAKLNLKDILEKAGIDHRLLLDPNARVPSGKVSRFFEIVVEESGDESIGLRLAKRQTPGSMHALGYSLFASRTLESFFFRFDRFFQLISHAADAKTEIKDSRLVHSFSVTEEIPSVREDTFLATVLQFVRIVYRSDYSPVLVRMRRCKPGESAASEFDAYFCCPIEYGHERLELHVNEADYKHVLRSANADIVRRNDQVAMEYIARFDEKQIMPRIRNVVIEMLPDGTVSLDAVAQRLHVSSRSLQRHLQDEGTSFNAVLDDIRGYLAVAYLRSGDRSIKEISYLLGYRDPSNFSRAFRRLTGVSPHTFLENDAQSIKQ